MYNTVAYIHTKSLLTGNSAMSSLPRRHDRTVTLVVELGRGTSRKLDDFHRKHPPSVRWPPSLIVLDMIACSRPKRTISLSQPHHDRNEERRHKEQTSTCSPFKCKSSTHGYGNDFTPTNER